MSHTVSTAPHVNLILDEGNLYYKMKPRWTPYRGRLASLLAKQTTTWIIRTNKKKEEREYKRLTSLLLFHLPTRRRRIPLFGYSISLSHILLPCISLPCLVDYYSVRGFELLITLSFIFLYERERENKT